LNKFALTFTFFTSLYTWTDSFGKHDTISNVSTEMAPGSQPDRILCIIVY